MLILTLRTDKPEAELGLFEGASQIAYVTWTAHRQLAETIHVKIIELVADNSKALPDIQGIAVYKGPGSFTGLRIGITVANALAGSLNVPITGAQGEDWCSVALDSIMQGKNEKIILPEYGAEVHITPPKH